MKMQMQHKLSAAERERESEKEESGKEEERERVWVPCAVSLQSAFYLATTSATDRMSCRLHAVSGVLAH